MRIGHTMIPPGVPLKRAGCAVVDPLPEEYGLSAGEPALRMCNTYWQLQVIQLQNFSKRKTAFIFNYSVLNTFSLSGRHSQIRNRRYHQRNDISNDETSRSCGH